METIYWASDHWAAVDVQPYGPLYYQLKNDGWLYLQSKKQWITKDDEIAAKVKDQIRLQDQPLVEERLVRRFNNYQLSYATAPDNPTDFPGLFDFQKVTPPELLKRNILLADEMGLGKTVQAIAALDLLRPSNCLIVVPNMLVMNWYDELSKWRTYQDTKVYIVPWSRLVKMDQNIVWDMAIIDEAHYAKNSSSKRSQAFSNIKAQRKMCLTGTPILGKPMEIFPIIDWIEPYLFGLENQFKSRYTTVELKKVWHGRYGYRYFNDLKPAHIDELQLRLRETIMISRLKRNVLPQLPEKTRTVVTMDATTEIKRLDKKMLTLWNQVKNDRGRDMEVWANIFRMRKEAALLKVPKVNAFVDEILEETESPIVVWCHHHEVADAIKNHYAPHHSCEVLDGRISPERRGQMVRDFQDGNIRILVAGLTAAGVGVTLTAASIAVFAELDWTPANMVQAEDRLHRIGTTEPVNIYYCVTAGSIDARIGEILERKQELIDQFTEMPDWAV